MTDIFAIQDEITQAIAELSGSKLSPDAGTRGPGTQSSAYEAYVKARGHWFKGTLSRKPGSGVRGPRD